MKNDNRWIDLLKELGLSRPEALTYLALLKDETASIRKLAERTGVNRGLIYEALKQLVVVGLVSVKKHGQREHYAAESPEKLYDLIRDKRRDLIDASRTAKQLVPQLLDTYAQAPGRPQVRYYEGDDGLATILKDVLQTCRNLEERLYYVYSAAHIRQHLYRKFPHFTERRIAEEIWVKVIAIEGGVGGEPAPFSERKLLPSPEHAETTNYVLIYGHKLAVISMAEDLTPYGVVVEDKDVASMQRFLFDELWSRVS